MRTAPVSNKLYRAQAIIKTKANKNHVYLYNEMSDFITKNKIGAVFKNNEIELPSISLQLLEKLRKLGIKFKISN